MFDTDRPEIIPNATPAERRNAKIGLFIGCSSLIGIWLFNADKAFKAVSDRVHYPTHVDAPKHTAPADSLRHK